MLFEIAVDVITLGEPMKADLARKKFLRNLSPECDRVGSWPRQGPSSWPSQHGQWQNPKLSTPRGSFHSGVKIARRITYFRSTSTVCECFCRRRDVPLDAQARTSRASSRSG